MKGSLAATKKPGEKWTLAVLGIEASSVGLGGAWSTVQTTTARPPKEAGKIVPDSDGAGVKALVDFLSAGKYI